ncbi:hypothetical protein D7Y13_17490 [Corallococcus praedator]|uniref:Uncharacterized protein n=1 Tax=Corallococcus praedator TaxID=2316724 RepID=A0ABX9QGW9_9BACT|nr:hypothetical protein D7X75_03705 [Corallococcus sp. CA031C]RKI07640.1 hypothetical protein D7Y13_17490 [Corallococcus praedator]
MPPPPLYLHRFRTALTDFFATCSTCSDSSRFRRSLARGIPAGGGESAFRLMSNGFPAEAERGFQYTLNGGVPGKPNAPFRQAEHLCLPKFRSPRHGCIKVPFCSASRRVSGA